MARTRNASAGFVQLDRQGNPISPSALNLQKARSLSGDVTLHGPGAEPLPPMQKTLAYRADPSSIARNIEAWDLVLLLDEMFRANGLPGFEIEVSATQWAAMTGDARRHFRPIYREEPQKVHDNETTTPEEVEQDAGGGGSDGAPAVEVRRARVGSEGNSASEEEAA